MRTITNVVRFIQLEKDSCEGHSDVKSKIDKIGINSFTIQASLLLKLIVYWIAQKY